jgi:pimeloyl-ACP methyl ester carboxylesterase
LGAYGKRSLYSISFSHYFPPLFSTDIKKIFKNRRNGGCNMFRRKTNKILLENSVADLIKINIGKFEQWVLIRGESVNNPLLLFLHGGPGTTNIGIAADTQKQLEKNFIVVNWDQLGAGLSYKKSIPKEAMTIEKMVEYTEELIQYLLNRFDKKKVNLVGHSWCIWTRTSIHFGQEHPYNTFLSLRNWF